MKHLRPSPILGCSMPSDFKEICSLEIKSIRKSMSFDMFVKMCLKDKLRPLSNNVGDVAISFPSDFKDPKCSKLMLKLIFDILSEYLSYKILIR